MGSNLPPGASDSDIPGNRPEDEEWEKVHDLLDSEASTYGWTPEEVREMLWWGVLVYRNIRERSKERLPVGTPGVRDPDFPCEAFRPGEPGGECETDGHYICQECAERVRFVCEFCGKEHESRISLQECEDSHPYEERIEDPLNCPDCGEQLSWNGHEYVCTACGRVVSAERVLGPVEKSK